MLDLSKYKDCLADKAFDSNKTKGRFGRADNDEDQCYFNVLDPFIIDVIKVDNSKAFRRSKDKTQVYKVPFNPHIRNRLDHMIEVTDTGRIISGVLGLNINLTEAIGKAHDQGHGPYGHACENVLTSILIEETGEDKVTFEHSLNSALVLELVERKGKGLNLCSETLDGILNHSAREKRLTIDPSLPPEYSVIMIADKISYLTSDVNDSILIGSLKVNDPKYKNIINCLKKLGWDESKQKPIQRVIMSRFIEAICRESFDKGRLAFSEGKVYDLFDSLRSEMYNQVYFTMRWIKEMKFIKKVFNILSKSSIDDYVKTCRLAGFEPRNPESVPNPYLVVSLLTDSEMEKLKSAWSLSLKKVILSTSLYQIVPYLLDMDFDLTSIYRKWNHYDNNSEFFKSVLAPLLRKHHNT